MRIYYRFYSLQSERNREDLEKALSKHLIRMKTYDELWNINDKKEGHFCLDRPLEENFKKKLKAEKLTYMIGCASQRLHNLYMWKRFANEGKGICLAFSCADSDVKAYKIKYEDELPKAICDKFKRLNLEKQVLFALLHKRKKYGYEIYEKEEETRFLKRIYNGDTMSIANIIVYLGWAMPENEARKWIGIAQDNGIKIISLRKQIKDNNNF